MPIFYLILKMGILAAGSYGVGHIHGERFQKKKAAAKQEFADTWDKVKHKVTLTNTGDESNA